MIEINEAILPMIEVLGYEQDPLWVEHISHLFEGIENSNQIGKVRENLNRHFQDLIDKKWNHDWISEPTTIPDLADQGYVDIAGAEIQVKKPFGIGSIAEEFKGIDITKTVCFGKGVKIARTIFDAPTYVCEDARIEYSSIQHQKVFNFIGPRSVVSNTPEFRGTFVGSDCYIHALNTGNMIVGSGSGIGRCHVQNHQIIKGNATIINPKTLEVVITKDRHIPTFIGRNVEIVGYGTVLTGGTIIGKHCKIDHNQNIDGLVRTIESVQVYESKHPVKEVLVVG